MAQIPLSGSIGVPGSVYILGNASVVFPSNADYTLLASEYSNKFLEVTSGVSLSTTRKLIGPLNQGQEFTIQNLTTGGQSIQIIGSSGTGITIANGATISVVCDGTNYLQTSGSASGTAGGDLSGTYPNPTVIKIQNNPVVAQVLTSPFDGYVLTWDNTDGYWKALPGPSSLPPSGAAGGDLSGTYPNPTVAKINGTSVNASPSANQLLVATSSTISTWAQLVDAYVSATAAIAGTKISPNFGSQVVQTTGDGYFADGYFTGLVKAASIRDTGLSTGIVHSDSSGNFTSSLIINADVSSSAAIAVSKLAAGTSGQILQNNGTPVPTWTTISGDISITNAGAVTVTALQGFAVSNTTPTTNYVLTWNGSAWAPATVSGSLTLAGDVTGAANANTIGQRKAFIFGGM